MPENRVELEFSKMPNATGGIIRTLFAGRPAQAPENRLGISYRATWKGGRADPAVLARYRNLVGMTDDGTIPTMYIHALVMPLRLTMMTHGAFPMRLMGLVHFTNRIEVTRPIRADETFDIVSTIEGIKVTEKGQAFDAVTELSVGGEVVWKDIATFLAPLPPGKRAKDGKPAAPKPEEPDWGEPIATWNVPANAGRVFSSIASDINPIHMSAFTAKLFGFKRAIAHGMFSAGRCYAEILKTTPIESPVAIDVRFKRPLFIPGKVALHAIKDADDTRFLLKVLPKGEPHVEGRISKLQSST